MAADERIETVGGALRGVMADPEWLKRAGIGALINLIPYVGMVWVLGYGLHYQRALAWRQGDRLPDWKPAGPQLKTGFYALVVGMAYSLPFSLLIGIGMSAVMVGGTLSTAGSAQSPGAVFWVTYAVSMVLMVVLGLAMSALLWPVYVQVNLYDRIEVGFQFKDILARARANADVWWQAVRRSLGLAALSLLLTYGIFGALIGLFAVAGPAFSERLLWLAIVALVVGELLAFALASVIGVVAALASHRIWAGYARTAYALEASERA